MDTLKVSANERIDLSDFSFATSAAIETASARQGDVLYCRDGATRRAWILSGFALTNPSGKTLQVAGGRALLSTRVDGAVKHGYLLTEGDATKTIDLTSLPSGTYGVFVRFDVFEQDIASRVFWNPASAGSEYVASVATRRSSNWSLRVDLGTPGAEWLQIGTANNSGGSLAIVDQRPLFFEGVVGTGYTSGWSIDGGGSANDRNSNRVAYGVQDLQTAFASMRECLRDIKGRGLRAWYARDIGGMNLGFDADPVEDRLALGDANMHLLWSATVPHLQWDSGDLVEYNRSTNVWSWKIGTVEQAKLDAVGLYATNLVTAPKHQVDANFYAELSSGDPRLNFDSGDYLNFSRSFFGWQWLLGNVERMRITATGLDLKDASATTRIAFLTGDDYPAKFYRDAAIAAYRNHVTMLRSRSGGAVQANDVLGGMCFGGAYAAGAYAWGDSGGAEIVAKAVETWGAGARGASLSFLTTPNGSSIPALRLYLAQNGAVSPGANNQQDFGLTGTRWKDIYAAGRVYAGNITVAANGNIIPIATAGAVGLTTDRWEDMATRRIHVSDAATVTPISVWDACQCNAVNCVLACCVVRYDFPSGTYVPKGYFWNISSCALVAGIPKLQITLTIEPDVTCAVIATPSAVGVPVTHAYILAGVPNTVVVELPGWGAAIGGDLVSVVVIGRPKTNP